MTTPIPPIPPTEAEQEAKDWIKKQDVSDPIGQIAPVRGTARYNIVKLLDECTRLRTALEKERAVHAAYADEAVRALVAAKKAAASMEVERNEVQATLDHVHDLLGWTEEAEALTIGERAERAAALYRAAEISGRECRTALRNLSKEVGNNG